MSSDRHRISRESAERLLNALPTDPQAASDPLTRLLAAACAHAHEAEPTGEDAAVAAFHAAGEPHTRTSPSRTSWKTPQSRFPFTRLLTAKIAASALVATAAGGAALAASTDSPPFWSSPGPKPAARPAQPSSATDSSDPSNPSDSPNLSNPSKRPAVTSATTPSPAQATLCRAYTAMAMGTGRAHPDSTRRNLDNPAFASLAAAAGGEEKIAGYCAKVLAAAVGRRPAAGDGERPGKSETSGTPSPRRQPDVPDRTLSSMPPTGEPAGKGDLNGSPG